MTPDPIAVIQLIVSIFDIALGDRGDDSKHVSVPSMPEGEREAAARQYLAALERRHGQMKILGMDRPVSLRSLFVKVSVLEKLTRDETASAFELQRLYDRDMRRTSRVVRTVAAEHLFSDDWYSLDLESYVTLESAILGGRPVDSYPVNERRHYERILDLLANGRGRQFGDRQSFCDFLLQIVGEIDLPPLLEVVVPRCTIGQRFVVLGKPGAGKTTFLKHLAVMAAGGTTRPLLPIFVSLHEYAHSELSLVDWIGQVLQDMQLPHAQHYAARALDSGKCLLLLDGLDEVPAASESRVVREINLLADRFHRTHIAVSCRIAAFRTTLGTFREVEIADFNDRQIRDFVGNWFGDDRKLSEACIGELTSPSNREILELGSNPLLLTLLCLAYQSNLQFPRNRAEIYGDAIDALLKRWDTSRGIKRNDTYGAIKHRVKLNLIANVAADTFMQNEFFVQKRALESRIDRYLSRVSPGDLPDIELDASTVLNSIEAQHGIIVERARDVYAFSHLTLQEYFTAHHIVYSRPELTIPQLVSNHFLDRRWREVFHLVSGLLCDGDPFFDMMLDRVRMSARKMAAARVGQLLADLAGTPTSLAPPMAHIVAFCCAAEDTASSMGLVAPCKRALLDAMQHFALADIETINPHLHSIAMSAGTRFTSASNCIEVFSALWSATPPALRDPIHKAYADTLREPQWAAEYLVGCTRLLECVAAGGVISLSLRSKILANVLTFRNE